MPNIKSDPMLNDIVGALSGSDRSPILTNRDADRWKVPAPRPPEPRGVRPVKYSAAARLPVKSNVSDKID
jgi:hypothetical protein